MKSKTFKQLAKELKSLHLQLGRKKIRETWKKKELILGFYVDPSYNKSRTHRQREDLLKSSGSSKDA